MNISWIKFIGTTYNTLSNIKRGIFMARLPNEEFRQMIPLLREKGFYESEEPKKISWSQYTIAQIEEAKSVLTFIKDSVDTTKYMKMKGKVGRPLTNTKELAKTILISEFLSLTERQTQGWIEILGSFVGIPKKIDDRVIGEAYNRPEVLYILKQVFDKSKTSDGKLSGDGTGLETSRKQNYEIKKKTGSYLVSIVDSREIVQAFEINDKCECQVMRRLIKLVDGESIRLDAGFNCRELVEEADKLNLIPFVFPKKNNNLNGSLAWKNMYLDLFYDVMQWLIEYHQRSHTESFHSSFKRKNKVLMKRRLLCELSQVTGRIIIHNVRRLLYFNQLILKD